MSLKNIFISTLLMGGTILSINAAELDYTFGVGGGLQSNMYNNSEMSINNEYLANPTAKPHWHVGGFVGVGATWQDKSESGLSQSTGVEWRGKFESFNSSMYIKPTVDIERVDYQDIVFGQFLDSYYRLGLNFAKAVPMGIQFNTGFAYRTMLSSSVKRKDGTYIKDFNPPISAFGFHAGMRFNLHMFFLSVDHVNFPFYWIGDRMHYVSSSFRTLFSGTEISFTVGLTFNKAIFDSFTPGRRI